MVTVLSADPREMLDAILAMGLAHGPRVGVSASVQKSIPPALPKTVEPPSSPAAVHTLKAYVQSLETLYNENRFMIDPREFLGVKADWWRRNCLGWIARRFVVDGGQGSMLRFVQSLLSDQSKLVTFDMTILYSDIFKESDQRHKPSRSEFLGLAGKVSPAVLHGVTTNLCSWLDGERDGDFQLWLDQFIPVDRQTEFLTDRCDRRKRSRKGIEEVPRFSDGWPSPPVQTIPKGWMALMSAVDYSSIYSVPELVQMALYHHDPLVKAQSLYAMVDLSRCGFGRSKTDVKAIRQFLLSPFGPGLVRRVENCAELLHLMTEHLSYRRVIRDVVWAEACNVICSYSKNSVLPSV